MAFRPITRDRLQQKRGDFRAQLPHVSTVRIALDYGFLKDRSPVHAEDILIGAGLVMMVGPQTLIPPKEGETDQRDEYFQATPFVALKPRVDAMLAEVPVLGTPRIVTPDNQIYREHYLRFMLKWLQPDAYEQCHTFFREQQESVRSNLLELAKPFLNKPTSPVLGRPDVWSKAPACRTWMGQVVEMIEEQIGGTLATKL